MARRKDESLTELNKRAAAAGRKATTADAKSGELAGVKTTDVTSTPDPPTS